MLLDVAEEGSLPEAARARLDELGLRTATHTFVRTYEDCSSEEVLQALLPSGVEVPHGFETVGTIAHFNLRDQLLPYKQIIGEVILDKNPALRTVVNKVGVLANEFRTFSMEVLAGENSTETSVKENGLKLFLDYSKVYWNSRLSGERERVLQLLSSGEYVWDMMAGIGAMAIFAAKKGCKVFANDLNPAGYECIERNAAENQADLRGYNLDAREFVRVRAAEDPIDPPRTHVIMNLPEIAVEFLDAFPAVYDLDGREPCREFVVHCYCFAVGEPRASVDPRVEAALGFVPRDLSLHEVRGVAPNKTMFCAEFTLRAAAKPKKPRVDPSS